MDTDFHLFRFSEPNLANMNPATRKDEEERVRRAAEREGRRTRRRRDREKIDIKNTHMDGMSSDDEIPDHEATLYKNQISTKLLKFSTRRRLLTN